MTLLRLSDCFEGATAVVSGTNSDYFLAVSDGILHITKEGIHEKACDVKERILDLTSRDHIIAGSGDAGRFIISLDAGRTWSHKKLPTSASAWSICINSAHMIVTHSNYQLYLSFDYGDTWQTYQPFQLLGQDQPAIRSICIDGSTLYLGTKIHSRYGGVWSVNLTNHHVKRLKHDRRMIASLLKRDNTLICAAGTCRKNLGSVDFAQLASQNTSSITWKTCHATVKEACYLDLSEHNGYLYTTTSHDKQGLSHVARVYLSEQKIVPCTRIHGHGWRVTNHEDRFLVAGLYESLFSTSYMPQHVH